MSLLDSVIELLEERLEEFTSIRSSYATKLCPENIEKRIAKIEVALKIGREITEEVYRERLKQIPGRMNILDAMLMVGNVQ